MSMRSVLGLLARRVSEKLGFYFFSKKSAPYGFSMFNDISRIARAWDWKLNVVFDVGANIGQFAREVRKNLPDSYIYSFEPHPLSYQRLASENSGERFKSINVALGDKIGEATLYVYGGESETSTINSLNPDARFPVRYGYVPDDEIKVRCTTIDSYCESNNVSSIDLLKVDTEGFDLSVLRGSARMLKDGHVRFIYVEFNDLFSKAGVSGGALYPIADFLAQFGYEWVLTYNDSINLEAPMFTVSNALFVSTQHQR